MKGVFCVSSDVAVFSGRLVSVYIRLREFYEVERGTVESGTVVEKKVYWSVVIYCGFLFM